MRAIAILGLAGTLVAVAGCINSSTEPWEEGNLEPYRRDALAAKEATEARKAGQDRYARWMEQYGPAERPAVESTGPAVEM